MVNGSYVVVVRISVYECGPVTQRWLNLFQAFKPDIVVADFSPTAVFAAHLTGLPFVLIGNGFEIPPATNPLPAFPGFSWARPEDAARSEVLVVGNANLVAKALGARPLKSLAQILSQDRALLATYPELDHYGERLDTRYIGPLLGDLAAPAANWPGSANRGIFVVVRPNTVGVTAILRCLSQIEAPVICVAAGFNLNSLRRFGGCNIRFVTTPVLLAQIARTADLCVSYGAEGTMMIFIQAGTPLVISPGHVEAKLSARRIAIGGLGTILPRRFTAESATAIITTAMHSVALHKAAAEFAASCAARQIEPADIAAARVIESSCC